MMPCDLWPPSVWHVLYPKLTSIQRICICRHKHKLFIYSAHVFLHSSIVSELEPHIEHAKSLQNMVHVLKEYSFSFNIKIWILSPQPVKSMEFRHDAVGKKKWNALKFTWKKKMAVVVVVVSHQISNSHRPDKNAICILCYFFLNYFWVEEASLLLCRAH